MDEKLSPEETEKKKSQMTEIATKKVSNEEIAKDIEEKCGFMLMVQGFGVKKPEERSEKNANAEGSNSSGSNSTSGIVNFGEGKVEKAENMLIPVEQTISLPAGDLDSKRKEAIKKKAEKSQAEKEDREAERDK